MTVPSINPLGYLGLPERNPPDIAVRTPRNPTTSDFRNVKVGDFWQNTSTTNFFMCTAIVGPVATWEQITQGGTGDVNTLTGNSGGAVAPDVAGNINVVGDGTSATVTGDPITNTLTVSLVGGAAVSSFDVDAVTPPGTDPVVPLAGVVTVTGGQVAAGTTVNAIRTASLAANTYTIQIQRSSAQATTTIGANGISHFDSSQFSVDANGFVQLTAPPNPFLFAYTNVTTAMSPYTVLTTDYYLSVNSTAGAVTLLFPNAATANRTYIVKDRTGTADTNNITITTVGGAVNIDGATTFVMNTEYEAANLVGNATSYEVY